MTMERRHFLGLTGAAALGVGAGRSDLLAQRANGLAAIGDAAAGFGPATPAGPPLAGRAADVQEDPRVLATFRLIEEKMAEYHVPGVGFGLVDGDRVVLRGFGITNVDNPQPVEPDTVFPIASISKTTVATAVLRLAEEGRIDVEAPLRTYMPDFRVADAAASREVRVWHLLTHTPGWEGQLGTADRGPATMGNFVDGLADLPQLARPGEVWSYNNAAFGVAGRLLEVVNDSTVNDALHDLVFEPLGLDRAFTQTGTAMTYRFSAPHIDRDGRTVVIRPFSLPANVSAGGAAMSVGSMMRYARFHLGMSVEGADTSILSMAGREAMRTARITKNATTDEMGLGWHLRRLNGVLTAAHGGTLGGHCLHVQLVPERRFAFSILTNHNQGWRLIHDVEQSILARFQDLHLAPGQRTGGNRGGNEMMTTHGTAMAVQPSPDEYVGTYRRPPVGASSVASVGDRLVVRGDGPDDPDVPLVFWGEDLAWTEPPLGVEYPYLGMPVEFIRDGTGSVRWMRVNGRIARKG